MKIIDNLIQSVKDKTDPLRETKQQEAILRYIKKNPDKLANITDKKFRSQIIKDSKLSNTRSAKLSRYLDNKVRKVNPKFDPHKFTKAGAVTGAVTGSGVMVGLGAINPALAATPFIGPASMSVYGTGIGSILDKLRIAKLGESNPKVAKAQNILIRSKSKTNSDYKELLNKAKLLKDQKSMSIIEYTIDFSGKGTQAIYRINQTLDKLKGGTGTGVRLARNTIKQKQVAEKVGHAVADRYAMTAAIAGPALPIPGVSQVVAAGYALSPKTVKNISPGFIKKGIEFAENSKLTKATAKPVHKLTDSLFKAGKH